MVRLNKSNHSINCPYEEDEEKESSYNIGRHSSFFRPDSEGEKIRKVTSLEMDVLSEKPKEILIFVNPEKKRDKINYKHLDRLRGKRVL